MHNFKHTNPRKTENCGTEISVYVEFGKSNNILARISWGLLRFHVKANQSFNKNIT